MFWNLYGPKSFQKIQHIKKCFFPAKIFIRHQKYPISAIKAINPPYCIHRMCTKIIGPVQELLHSKLQDLFKVVLYKISISFKLCFYRFIIGYLSLRHLVRITIALLENLISSYKKGSGLQMFVLL